MTKLETLIASGEAPAWMDESAFTTLSKGYMLEGETPRAMYSRISNASAARLQHPEYAATFFDLMWRNWLCPATPVAANMGTTRGLPISCLTGDSWLNTPTGGKQIKDIRVGDLVLSHKGRWQPVTNVQVRQSTDDLYMLKVGTRTTPTRITGNHPVLTNLGWVRVDELDTEKHLIATNHKIEYGEDDHTIDMEGYCTYPYKIDEDGLIVATSTNKLQRKRPKHGTISYITKVRKQIEVTNDLAWALGLWFAEGSLSTNKGVPNGVRITLGSHEADVAERWLRVMTDAFSINGNTYSSELVRKGKKNSWISANVHSKLVGAYFASFGKGCKRKNLTPWMLDLPKEKLSHFLDGMMTGDGSIAGTSCSLTLANPELLMAVYNVCLKLGKNVSLQMQRKAGKLASTRYVYTLIVRKCTTPSVSKSAIRAGIQFEDLVYCPIIKLEKLDYNETVYDITVAEDHSFSVHGFVVHNCFSVSVSDSIDGIMSSMTETAMLAKHGGGVGTHWDSIRARGSRIGDNGISEGVVPFLKILDSVTIGISQGSTRRGASVAYLSIEHADFDEFINIRRPQGDANRQCLNINHAVTITDAFMEKVVAGDPEARRRWRELLKTRFETGEPYIQFIDTVNRDRPDCYKGNDLKVQGSNLCLAGDTQILTKDGHASIRDLVGRTVSVFDGVSWVETDTFRKTNTNADIVEVELRDGSILTCTPYHRFVTDKGAFVEAKDLQPKQKLMRHTQAVPGTCVKPDGTFAEVKEVRILDTKADVYCCTIPTTGQFALSAGIMSGNCSEIELFTDSDHTFVCCLSSMNLARWKEWKDTDAVYWSIVFLDGVMSEFIDRAQHIQGFERAVRFSQKSRALGLGVLGWHSYLQDNSMTFDGMEAYLENRIIFQRLRKEADRASADLAKEYGEPEWCRGYGRRNTHCLAVAPTASNSVISGGVSPGIEPIAANAFAQKTAKGTFLRQNKALALVLEAHGKNTPEVWKTIVNSDGSVQHLSFLSKHEKEVFQTAREINQFVIVKLAAARQQYLDQTQSLNLFWPANTDPMYFNKVHLEAWKLGVHTLYYCRTSSVLKGDSASKEFERHDGGSATTVAATAYKRDISECTMCEG